VVHQPVSRGLAVFADAWLWGWLAEISADLRENGSASEVVLHDDALYKSTTLLFYSSSELHVFRHLWSRSDAPCSSISLCMGITICCRRKFGHVWGFPAPLPEVAGNLRSPLDLRLPHEKIGIGLQRGVNNISLQCIR